MNKTINKINAFRFIECSIELNLKKKFKTLYLQTRSAVYDNDFNEKKNNKKIN
jgi:hypothetical protein